MSKVFFVVFKRGKSLKLNLSISEIWSWLKIYFKRYSSSKKQKKKSCTQYLLFHETTTATMTTSTVVCLMSMPNTEKALKILLSKKKQPRYKKKHANSEVIKPNMSVVYGLFINVIFTNYKILTKYRHTVCAGRAINTFCCCSHRVRGGGPQMKCGSN